MTMLSTVSVTGSEAKYRYPAIRRTPAPAILETEMIHGTVRHIAAREHVFLAGDLRTHLFRIDSGAVCLYKITAGGQRQVVQFAFAGDLLGLAAQNEYALSAQALRPVRLRCLPVVTLNRMAAGDPALGGKLYEALSAELASLQEHLLIIGQRNALERVAAFLLGLSRRNARIGGDPAALELPMTRGDISDYLGLTLETVCRMLSKLRAAGVIEAGQSSPIALRDLEKLEELAAIG
jgi:CRP/FNR family transcriptional regulator, anaerobic regulatory protein